ncbi:MAG: DUF58 domain-containing protein [Sporolactobacillus sp.]|jgi:uncharacterized protein (DUF58 family)|nr:DUF58 domain-containing protein [Sporolactobacillus sp.]
MKPIFASVRRKVRLFLRTAALFTLFPLLFYFAMVQGGFVAWFLFYAFLPVILYDLLLLFYPLKTIKLIRTNRDRRSRLTAGDTCHLRLILRRRFALPLFLVTIQAAQGERHGQMAWIDRELSFDETLYNLQRGKYGLPTIIFAAGDPFGFLLRRVQLRDGREWLVYPRVTPVIIPEIGLGTSHVRLNGSDHFGEFIGVRDYQPNDRLAQLDWKSTAKSDRLVTKQYDPEEDYRAAVVFAVADDTPAASFERGISLTASLVTELLRDGYEVRLTWRHSSEPTTLRKGDHRQLEALYADLAVLGRSDTLRVQDVRLEPERRRTGFAVAAGLWFAARLGTFASRAAQKQTLFYLTDERDERLAIPQSTPMLTVYPVTGDRFTQLRKSGRSGDE